MTNTNPTFEVKCTYCSAKGISYKSEIDDALADLYFEGWRECNHKGKEGVGCPECVKKFQKNRYSKS